MPAIYAVSYTSISKMLSILPDLGSVTTLTSAQLFEFAGQAESEINAALVKKYSLPLSGEVPILTTLATDIAIYKVLTRRLFTSERLAASPWPDRYKEAVAQLDKIAAGDLMLVDASGTAIGDRTDLAETFSTTQNYVPTMWEGPTPDHVIDPQKIKDEADRRGLTVRDRLL